MADVMTPERFDKQFEKLSQLRAAQTLEEHHGEEAAGLYKHLTELLVSAPEIVHFYQNAFLRFKQRVEKEARTVPAVLAEASRKLYKANEFFREFGSFLLSQALDRGESTSPLLIHIAPESADREVSETTAEPEVSQYTPWTIQNRITGEHTPLPDELTEAVLLALCENSNPMDTEDIREWVERNSSGQLVVKARDITPVIKWIEARVTAEAGPHLIITDPESGRWKAYRLAESELLEWIQPAEIEQRGTPPAEGKKKRTVAQQPNVMAELELDTVEAAILSYALERGEFRIEELHQQVPVLRNMTQEEYDTFKKTFKLVRNRIATSLSSQGGSAEWIVSGQARGRRYRLVTDGAPISSSGERQPPNETPDQLTRLEAEAATPAEAPEEITPDQVIDLIQRQPGISRDEFFKILNARSPKDQNHLLGTVFPKVQRKLASEGLQLSATRANGEGKRYTIEAKREGAKNDNNEQQAWRFTVNRQGITDGEKEIALTPEERRVVQAISRTGDPLKSIARRLSEHMTQPQVKDILDNMRERYPGLIRTRQAARGGAKTQYFIP